MSKQRKPKIPKYKYDQDKDIEKMIGEYVEATGDKGWSRMKVAQWAISEGKWEQHQANALKELAKNIGRVAGKATFVDKDTGDVVRKYHAYHLGEEQPMLWSAINVISPENMKTSINSRREKLVGGAVKAIIDAEYFNRHHNPGDPITVETDLTQDVKEKRSPGLYDDSGPTDEPAPV